MATDRHSYVRFFPSDWDAGTAHMSPFHELVYFKVCKFNWDKNAPCPMAHLALVLGAVPNWRDLLGDLIAAGKLIQHGDGSAAGSAVASPRALAESQRAYDTWLKKSRGGREGAEKTNKIKGRGGSGGGSDDGTHDGSAAGSADGIQSQNQNQNQIKSARARAVIFGFEGEEERFEQFRRMVAKQTSDASYREWLQPCTLRLDDGWLVVEHPEGFHRRMAEQSIGQALRVAAPKVLGDGVQVTFAAPVSKPAQEG